MATPIQRIEKEYLLGALNYKGIPLKCFVGKDEYTFTLEMHDKDSMILRAKERLSAFWKDMKIELKFSAQSTRASIITFRVSVYEVADKCLITSIPDCLYKNLSRAYSRVQQMFELNMVMQKDGFYYDLNYGKLSIADSMTFDNFVFQLDEKDVDAAMEENLNWIKQTTDGYKLILFKDNAPSSIEEKAISKLGKVLFISMPNGGLVSDEEKSGEIFFTEQSFYKFLLDSGENPIAARKKIADLIRQRIEHSVCCDCYIPVIFSYYIIGYIHIWVKQGENPPLLLSSIEKFRRFAKIIAFSLERDNYFENGKKRVPIFTPKLVNISVGGFLFELDPGKAKITYSVNDHFSVQITIASRIIRCNASIVRNYFDKAHIYYGCKFGDMEIEDTRFLFEALYGKPFTDNDIQFIAGAV